MFSNHFTTNLSHAAVKKFWKSVSNWPRYWQNFVASFFGPPCSWKLVRNPDFQLVSN